jgi:hypothetical protein
LLSSSDAEFSLEKDESIISHDLIKAKYNNTILDLERKITLANLVIASAELSPPTPIVIITTTSDIDGDIINMYKVITDPIIDAKYNG